jgi:hypothetical protein
MTLVIVAFVLLAIYSWLCFSEHFLISSVLKEFAPTTFLISKYFILTIVTFYPNTFILNYIKK